MNCDFDQSRFRYVARSGNALSLLLFYFSAFHSVGTRTLNDERTICDGNRDPNSDHQNSK